jgi:hypothetical protein
VRVDWVDHIGLGILRICVLGCSWVRLPFHVYLASVSFHVYLVSVSLKCTICTCYWQSRACFVKDSKASAWGSIRFLAEGGKKKLQRWALRSC